MTDKKTQIEPLLISATKAAGLLGIGRSMFYQMHSSGRLGLLPISFGKRKLWSKLELRLWVESGCPARSEWQKRKGNNG